MTGRCVQFGILASLVAALLLPVSTARAKEPATALASIRVVPQNAKVRADDGASQHFLVLAKYADGRERDVTPSARFSLSEPDKGEVNPAGKFVLKASGRVNLTAKVGGLKANSEIEIEKPDQPRPISFLRDIVSIFTRRGCNGTSCHGSVKGKNGFKLSINGMYPHDDYKWIVEGGTYKVLTADTGPKNPRVDLKEPEKSLILLKPTLTIPHGGGQRFKSGSRDYQTILNWVRAGAPYGPEAAEGGVSIERVEVFPKEAVLDLSGRQQLLVTAYLSNGRQQDLTEDVLYTSNDASVADISDEGVVEAKKSGETAVLIRASRYALSATVDVIGNPVENYPAVQARNYIDRLVFTKLRRLQIVPSPLSSDEEFLRRVCLDLAGTLPPIERVRQFAADRDPMKRDRVIEALLDSPEYVDYWSFRLEDLMRATFVTSNEKTMAKAYEDWIIDSVASNKPYDQMARERIAAQGYSAPARNFYNVQELSAPETVMPELVRVFMGRRIECAQCHNHPFEAWSQDQFWGLAAFFGGMTELFDSNVVLDALGGGHVDQPKEMVVINPRTKAKVVPAFLDGTALPQDQYMDPRMALAAWMTSHPYFAEASVNRVWSYFLGRGIVEPVDDFRSTNPPSNPELLQELAKDFRDSGYNLKHLMRTIVQSRTYQLSGTSNPTNKDDVLNCSHARPRALAAAVLLDAITSVTGVPEKFEYRSVPGGGDAPIGSKAMQMMPDLCPSTFLDAFGRSMRKALPVNAPGPNLLEAMDMIAGPAFTSKITEPGGRLDRLMRSGASDGEIIDQFYLAALSRAPTSPEKNQLLALIAERSPRRQEALSDVAWALVSSREFAYNH